jgi:hypothetical protein
MADVVLRFDYIDDEIRWPKAEENRLIEGYVKAVANTRWGFKEAWLNVRKIKRIYAFGGKLYVLYDAEDVRMYGPFLARLPPFVAEIDYKVYYEADNSGGCKIWRFSLDTFREEETFLKRLLGTEVELTDFVSLKASPVNFVITPVDVVLYKNHITGIAVAENPKFRKDACGDEEETCGDEYEGRYIVLKDDYSYVLFRIYGDAPPLEKLLERLTSPCGTT